MARESQKNKTKEYTLAKILYITCLRSQTAHLHFKILLLKENLNTFYLGQAEAEVPSVAQSTYSFPLTKLTRTFT